MTFKYPGRNTLTAEKFLQKRPDIRAMKIYDLQLSTGDLLYRCAPGGTGVTKEKFIPQLHAFIQRKNCASVLEEMWDKEFHWGDSEKLFIKARSLFNSKMPRIQSWTDCARLYCLLACSGYNHNYYNKSFTASYFPYRIDFNYINIFSEMSRSGGLQFDTTDMLSFREKELDKTTVIYMHMPIQYGKYGLGYVWSKRKLKTIQTVFNDLDQLGYSICVSALYEKRNALVHKENVFPSFHTDIVIHQNDEKYGLSRLTSEIYYTNFAP